MNTFRAKWLSNRPALVVILWLAIAGIEIAVIALHTATPPFFDALSYADKARNFWNALGHGTFVNPLNVAPAIRPPGTILLTYPFGYTADFHWFYFRSAYIPLLLLAGAVYVAADAPALSRAAKWLLSGMTLALAAMPALYRFQPVADIEPPMDWNTTWSVFGHVDNYMAGVAAVALAAAIRSVRGKSVGWALAAALAATLCLFIKPTGAFVMAVVGLGWIALVGFDQQWNIARMWRDPKIRYFVIASLGGAVVIFALAAGAEWHSAYFSPENVTLGNRSLAVLHAEYHTPLTTDLFAAMFPYGLGYIVPVAIGLGLFAVVKFKSGLSAAIVSIFCVAAGLLLLIASDPGKVRYFLPFAAMGFVAMVPVLLRHAERIAIRYVYAATVIAMASPLAVAILLAMPHPPFAWQRAAGINVPNDDYKAEIGQATGLIRDLQSAGTKQTSLYLFASTSALYNFGAVLGDSDSVEGSRPQVRLVFPVDWSHPSAFHLDQIAQADYVAFEPVRDTRERAKILAQSAVPNFVAETNLMSAWFSTLGEADGVNIVSETHVRLLHVTDPARLEASLTRLQASHVWPESFLNANPQRWWSEQEVAKLRDDRPADAIDIDFKGDESSPVLHLSAAQIDRNDEGLDAKFWVRVNERVATAGWHLFAHLIDARGEILAGTESTLATPLQAEKAVHCYTFHFASRPRGAVAIAIGFYRPGDDSATFLKADSGHRDWNGQRALFPLPKP